jgi:hypothetical protein
MNMLVKIAAEKLKSAGKTDKQLAQLAIQRLAGSIQSKHRLLSLLLTNGPAGMLGGMLTAGVTPTWNREDAAEFVDDPNFKAKMYIPGYFDYKLMKAIGYKRALEQLSGKSSV